ncbi:uncharacterized protein LOC135849175 isoform X2 [Planococcus citri]|uniref:uncharacterized protein LOC135849175 isoform X2 n=1 Tax=Planococcus citri TaxID=170843 RepID=UPI0031FA1A4B
MWSNIQTSSNMGLQMLSNSGKRAREDCLNGCGDDDDDGPMPAKLGKTTEDSLWDEYYPAGKCYQCNEPGSAVAPIAAGAAVTTAAPTFYSSASAFACEQYNPASTQCWPAQLTHQGSPTNNNVNPSSAANAANQTNGSSQNQCSGVHLSNHNTMCNGTAVIANSSSISVSGGVATVPGSPPHPASVAPVFHGGPVSPQALAATVPPIHPHAAQQHQQHQQQQQQHHHQQQSQQQQQQQQQQQTIRCDENGKSYLDLGSGSAPPTPQNSSNVFSSSRCCNPRTKWCMCGPSCYRQRRLTVLNISMCKLGRYRQFTDPSLYRSVLICNTLRYIEREMEQEGCFANNQQQPPLIVLEPPPEPPRAPTPYPQTSLPEDNDSGIGDDNRSINWGSVLSLSSQSDLDPLNNNDSLGELDFSQDFEDIIPSCKLTPLSVDDILKTVPPTTQPSKESPDIDNIMQVLRFTN